MKHKVRKQWEAALALALLGAVLLSGCEKQVKQAEQTLNAAKGGEAKMADSKAAGQTEPGAAASGSDAGSTAGTASSANSGSKDFADISSLDLNIGNGTVQVKPAAEGAKASAHWSIEPGASINAAPPESLQVFVEDEGGTLKVHDKFSGSKLQIPPKLMLTLSLPAGTPLDCALGNGNLNIESNAELSANLGNGNLSLSGECPECDVDLGNGKLDCDWLITSGKHHVSVGNGTAKVVLRQGSSVSYSADTGAGTITLDGVPGSVEKAMVSQTATGSVGAGAAKLDISVGAGSLKIGGKLS